MDMKHPRVRRVARGALLGLATVFVFAQLVPYGRAHANPAAVVEPRWDQPSTRALAVRACFDCHSNETSWPWYSNIAPVSWLLQRHVDNGRRALNFSDWSRPYGEADESAELVLRGSMPTWDYRMIHPHARLSVAERQTLAAGLTATIGRGRARGGDDDESR
jgi:hypothetical protein